MWDIILYNSASSRATSASSRLGMLFDDDSLFPSTINIIAEEEEDTVEMEICLDPTVEVLLSNGQARPPQSNRPRSASAHHSSYHPTAQSTSSAPAGPQMDTSLGEPSMPAHWPVPANASPLDLSYDPFFQFQDPGSPFMGTWQVGNL